MFSKEVKEFLKIISSPILLSYSIPLKFLPFADHVYPAFHTLPCVELPLLYLVMKTKFFKVASAHPLKAWMLQGYNMERESPAILPFANKVIWLHHISAAFELTFPFYNAGNIQHPKKRK